jgi:hypothetical protein
MSKNQESLKEVYGYNDGNFEYADKMEKLFTQIQVEKGSDSENRAKSAFEMLLSSGEILDFEDMTGTLADYCESTDFWVTLLNGKKRRVQVKSSASTIRRHSHEPKYKDISFLVVKQGETIHDIAQKIREHILARTR